MGQISTLVYVKSHNCILQVQEDLKQLKCALENITVNERGETLDIQALDAAIGKTERSLRVRMLHAK